MSAVPAIGLGRALRRAGPCGAHVTSERLRRSAQALIEEEQLFVPTHLFRIHPAARTAWGGFAVGHSTLHVPGFAAIAAGVTGIAAAVCTLGPRLEARVSTLFAERRPALALALDTLGTDLLFAVSRLAQLEIRREARQLGWRAGAELSPGDAGLDFSVQETLLELCGGDPGVALTAGGMLAPLKSLSFLAPLGPALVPDMSPRCSRCEQREGCRSTRQ